MSRLLRQNGTIHWKPWKPRSWLGPFSDSELPVLTMEWLQLWTFRMDLNVLVSCGVVFVLVWETPKLGPFSSVFPHEIPPDLAIAHLGSSCHLNRKLYETSPFLNLMTSNQSFNWVIPLLNDKDKWERKLKKKKVMLVTSGDLWVRFWIPIPLLLQEVH